MDPLIVFCAKYLLFAIALALGVYWLMSPRARKIELALTALVALPLAYALSRLAGLLLSHPQPFFVEGYEPLIAHEVDNSFPSDHSAAAGALAGLAGFYNRILGVLLWILAVAVAAGRMLAGLHYPVDVVAGLMLGGLCALASVWAVHLYFSARQHTGV